jgi:hypothetical protein
MDVEGDKMLSAFPNFYRSIVNCFDFIEFDLESLKLFCNDKYYRVNFYPNDSLYNIFHLLVADGQSNICKIDVAKFTKVLFSLILAEENNIISLNKSQIKLFLNKANLQIAEGDIIKNFHYSKYLEKIITNLNNTELFEPIILLYFEYSKTLNENESLNLIFDLILFLKIANKDFSYLTLYLQNKFISTTQEHLRRKMLTFFIKNKVS